MTRAICVSMAAAALILTACGGGDSAGGGGGSGSLSLSVATLNFSTTSLTATPPARTITATINASANLSGTLYIRIVLAGAPVVTVSDVQITGDNTGQALVTPAPPASLGIGTHTGTITVSACTTNISCTSGLIGTPQVINVTYVVNAASSSTSSLTYVIADGSADADYVKTVPLTASPPWTASSALAALTVAPASGTTSSTTLTVTLNRAVADAMPNGVTNTQLTINAAGGAQLIIPVTIDVRHPELKHAGPRIIPANQADITYISGAGLNNIAVGSVRIGSGAGAVVLSPSSFIVSANQIIIPNRPALPAGTYPIQFTDGSGHVINRSTASLLVVNPQVFAAQALSYPDARARHVTDLAFDVERMALVVGAQYSTGEADTQLLRYTYGSAWSAPVVQAMPYLTSLALKPDGSAWLATRLIRSAADNSIASCVPDLSSCVDNLQAAVGSQRWTRIGMTLDADPIVLGESRPASGGGVGAMRFAMASSTLRGVGPLIYDGILAASDDGNAVVIGSRGTASGTVQPLQFFRVPSATFSTTSIGQVVNRLVIDGRGARVVVNGSLIFDPNTFTQQASLPATSLYALLSRDSTRAYTFDADGKIHIFNLSVTMSSGQYPEIGAGITPAGDPGAGTNGQDMRMALSPDGKTLFLAGSQRVVVQPLP